LDSRGAAEKGGDEFSGKLSVEMKTRLQKLKKKGYDGGYW
jgi:hypothetical protein